MPAQGGPVSPAEKPESPGQARRPAGEAARARAGRGRDSRGHRALPASAASLWKSVGTTLEALQHLHFSFLLLKAPGPSRMDSGLNARSPFWSRNAQKPPGGEAGGGPHPAAPLPRVVSGPHRARWHQENPRRRSGPQAHASRGRGQHPLNPQGRREPVSSFIRKCAVCPGRSFEESSDKDDGRGT